MKKIFYVEVGDGMDAISLVEHPAVEYDFLKFSHKLALSFDEDKHIISGVVCLADTPIYRQDPLNGEWYVVFTKDTIRKMIIKYSKDNLWNSINLNHNDEEFVNSVFMIESYLKDSERGIVPKEFQDIPDGSWIVSFYVSDENIWNRIKSGEFKGFSLQGLFNLTPTSEEDELDALIKSILD